MLEPGEELIFDDVELLNTFEVNRLETFLATNHERNARSLDSRIELHVDGLLGFEAIYRLLDAMSRSCGSTPKEEVHYFETQVI